MELKATLKKLISMMLVIDNHGFELKFLNDDNWYKINSESDLEGVFKPKQFPRGMTPLKANLEKVLGGYNHGDYPEGDTILLVLTDGEPSDTNFNNLKAMIERRNKSVYVSFIMCTEDDDVVTAYEGCIDPLKGVDIVDDYVSEKKVCERVGNKLSYNKYLAKCLLGSKLDKYGHLDSHNMGPKAEGGCCSIL